MFLWSLPEINLCICPINIIHLSSRCNAWKWSEAATFFGKGSAWFNSQLWPTTTAKRRSSTMTPLVLRHSVATELYHRSIKRFVLDNSEPEKFCSGADNAYTIQRIIAQVRFPCVYPCCPADELRCTCAGSSERGVHPARCFYRLFSKNYKMYCDFCLSPSIISSINEKL